MAVQVAARNIAADAVGAAVAELSLHSTDGSTTGANELTGGNYTREVPSYTGAAAGGEDDLTASVVFGAPAALTTATHLGFWATGSVWLGSVALTESKAMSGTDTLTITSAPITA